jgi:hypothetical protein
VCYRVALRLEKIEVRVQECGQRVTARTDGIESLQFPNPGCVLLLLLLTDMAKFVYSALVFVS